MIELYTSPTPNGYKTSVALEELEIPYNVHVVNLMSGDQKKPEFLKLNPNGRIPVIVDTDNDNLAIMESGAQLIYLAEKAGFPPGVFNVITTNNPQNIGEILTKSPKIKKISFTGSSEVGKILIKQSSSTVKKLSMELGGNAPFIIFDDADIDSAVEGVMLSKFRNSGQTCICANRIYVQEGVYNLFLEKFISKVKNQKLGSGLDPSVEIGPLINKKATNKVLKILKPVSKKI